MVFALLLCACGPKPVERSPYLGYDMPPRQIDGFVRMFCHEYQPATLGCGYVGYLGEDLCLVVYATKDGKTFNVIDRDCKIGIEWSPGTPPAHDDGTSL